jgi:hypothetical protein
VSKNHNSIFPVFELSPLLEKSCPKQNLKTLGHHLLELQIVVEGIEAEFSAKESNM